MIAIAPVEINISKLSPVYRPRFIGLTHLGAIRAATVSAVVLATAAGPGLTGTLIDRGITLPTQMLFVGLYCLLAAGAMTIASAYLRRRSSISLSEHSCGPQEPLIYRRERALS